MWKIRSDNIAKWLDSVRTGTVLLSTVVIKLKRSSGTDMVYYKRQA